MFKPISQKIPLIRVLNLGTINYADGLLNQAKYIAKVNSSRNCIGYLLLLEHTPVYTVGLRTKDYPPEYERRLVSLGAEFHRTDRGGLVTFHGPGQLIAYPILNLKLLGLTMKSYVCNLEEVIIKSCKHLNIQSERSSNIGVWVKNNKLAAIGVHGKNDITSHGLALNCNTDLSWFSHIVPCGIKGVGVTSLTQLLQKEISVPDVLPYFVEEFERVFKCSLKDDLKEDLD